MPKKIRKFLHDESLRDVASKCLLYDIPLSVIFENVIVTNNQMSIIDDCIKMHESVSEATSYAQNKMDTKGPSLATVASQIGDTHKPFQAIEPIAEFVTLKELKGEIILLSALPQSEDQKNKLIKIQREYNRIINQIAIQSSPLVNWSVNSLFMDIPFSKEDAIGLGNEGLSEAIINFDYSSNTNFSSYAISIITQNIKNHFQELTGLSWSDFIQQKRIEFARNTMLERNPHRDSITPEELVKSGSVPYTSTEITQNDELISVMLMSEAHQTPNLTSSRDFPYDIPVTDDDYREIDDYTDSVEKVSDENVEEVVEAKELRNLLKTIIDSLSDQEIFVITEHYGFNKENRPKSLAEISKELNVTLSVARGIEERAIRKLKHPKRSTAIRHFINETPFPKAYLPLYTRIINLLNTKISLSGILEILKRDYGLNLSAPELKQFLDNLNELSSYIHKCVDNNMSITEIVNTLNNSIYYFKKFFDHTTPVIGEGFTNDFIVKVLNEYKITEYAELEKKSHFLA